MEGLGTHFVVVVQRRELWTERAPQMQRHDWISWLRRTPKLLRLVSALKLLASRALDELIADRDVFSRQLELPPARGGFNR